MSAQLQTESKVPIGKAFTPVSTGGLLQRKCACGSHSMVGDECEECKNNRLGLQRKASNRSETSEVPPIVYEVLRSPGRPLDPATRAFMEPRFGHDFSQVRVHTNAKAAESARAVDALAYTVGRNVVFDVGQFDPFTCNGISLLGHELTHVIQQGNTYAPSKLSIADADSSHESEAEHNSAAITIGRTQLNFVSHAPYLIMQRQPAPNLRPLPPVPSTPARTVTALRAIQGGLSQATTRSAERTGWRYFWRAVARRFALRGAVAAALAAADGPLPIGELIDLGLALWTIWEIVQLWDSIWSEASQLQQQEQSSSNAVPSAGSPAEASSRRRERIRPVYPDQDPWADPHDTPAPHPVPTDAGTDAGDPCALSPMKPCDALDNNYIYSSRADAASFLRNRFRNINLYTPGEEASESGYCFKDGQRRARNQARALGATHTTYYRQGVSTNQGEVGSIVCCDCCVAVPNQPSPEHRTKCAIV